MGKGEKRKEKGKGRLGACTRFSNSFAHLRVPAAELRERREKGKGKKKEERPASHY